MVSGNPYISTNKATMKAAKAPNERQSRRLCGFAKLSAKRMNTTEFMITRDHRPYAGAASFIGRPPSSHGHHDRRARHA